MAISNSMPNLKFRSAQCWLFLTLLVSFILSSSSSISFAAVSWKQCQEALTLGRGAWMERNNTARRAYVLPNGVRVLLISNPEFKEAAASVVLNSGSLHDPVGMEGAFHLLEHLVFIASKKYPEVDGFSQFIVRNGGEYNGVTSLTRTVYPFQIHPSLLNEALDRVFDLITQPIFSKEYLEKERRVVHEEYESALSDDESRLMHSMSRLTGKNHSFGREFQGNLRSLRRMKLEHVIELHKTHYISGNFGVVVAGPQSIEELHEIVRSTFGRMQKTKRPHTHFSSLPQHEGNQIPIVKVKTQFQSNLRLQIQLPPHNEEIKTSAGQVLLDSFLMRFPGSFSHEVLESGLVSSLDGSYSLEPFGNIFFIDFVLTEKGLTHWRELVSAFYRHLKRISTEGVSEDYLDQFFDSRVQGFMVQPFMPDIQDVERMGFQLFDAPVGLELEWGELPVEMSNAGIKSLAKKLTSMEGWHLQLGSPEMKGTKRSAAFEYRFSELTVPSSDFKKLKGHLLPVEFKIVETNPYFLLVGGDTHDPHIKDEIVHLKLKGVDEKISPRVNFKAPQKSQLEDSLYLTLEHHLESPKTLKEVALRIMAGEVLKEVIDLHSQKFNVALNDAEFSNDSKRFFLRLKASQKAGLKYLEEMGLTLKSIDIGRGRFEVLKDEMIKDIENKGMDPALAQIHYETSLSRMNSRWTRHELVAMLERVSFEDSLQKANEWLKESNAHIFVFGTRPAKDLRIALTAFYENLGFRAQKFIPRFSGLNNEVPGHRQSRILREGDGNAVQVQVSFGKTKDWKQTAAVRILNQHIKATFFTDLRTQKQLGYTVSSDDQIGPLNSELYFVIQSSVEIEGVKKALHEWVFQKLPKLASDITPVEFETLKGHLLHQMLMESHDLNQQFETFSNRFSLGWSNQDQQDFVSSIRELSLEEFRLIVQKAVQEQVWGISTVWTSQE